MNILLYILIPSTTFLAGYLLGNRLRSGYRASASQDRTEQDRRKQENKEKILNYVKEKGRVTNDEVETMLGVGNTTAWRYLDELEKKARYSK